MSKLNKAIGGYMELELPYREQPWLDGALKYNSARSAFVSLLEQLNVNSIWMPRYICDSMINAVTRQGIQIYFYSINQNFEIAGNVTPSRSTPLLYVNYFGLCEPQAQEVINRFGPDSVIIDNAQALFSKPFDCLGTIYSPRKFFGLPDGGLLYTSHPDITEPEEIDVSSGSRLGHLISRLTNSPEKAYEQFQKAEQAISKMPVLRMSDLTTRLLHSVDYEAAKLARNRNAGYLQDCFREYNQLELHINAETAPLCYPLLPAVKTAGRSEFINNRVFLPCYWPEVDYRPNTSIYENSLVANGFFIPCDQRYQKNDLNYVASLFIKNFSTRKSKG